jgi:hypothetical protein
MSPQLCEEDSAFLAALDNLKSTSLHKYRAPLSLTRPTNNSNVKEATEAEAAEPSAPRSARVPDKPPKEPEFTQVTTDGMTSRLTSDISEAPAPATSPQPVVDAQTPAATRLHAPESRWETASIAASDDSLCAGANTIHDAQSVQWESGMFLTTILLPIGTPV